MENKETTSKKEQADYIRDEWVESVYLNLSKTIQLLRSEFHRVANESGIDILTEQWIVLITISNGKLSHSEIAATTNKKMASISRTINLLKKRGLVKKVANKADNRVNKVQLTLKGNNLLKALFPKVLAVRKQSWNGLTLRDFEELVRILYTIQKNLS